MTWQWEKLNDCVERRFFSGERLTAAQFRLKAGCVVQRHSHPQEQLTIVLEGLREIEVGGRRFTAAAGDMVQVPQGKR